MKYIKNPLVVDAFQYDGDLIGSDGNYYVPDWAANEHKKGNMFYAGSSSDAQPSELYVRTPEGTMHVSVGDYIIRGTRGEIYPCNHAVFDECYKPAGTSYVRTPKNMGPRGDYYEWCSLLNNGTLEFGSEQGNYAGGTTLSYCFYGGSRLLPEDTPITDEYWTEVRKRLEYLKKNNPDFYQQIDSMCKENGVSIPGID